MAVQQFVLTRRIASVAVFSAIVALLTYLVRLPFAPTRGYIHMGDAAIFFLAFAMGPRNAFWAGALGTAVADLIGGYPVWAPISFVAHGLQGGLSGWLTQRQDGRLSSLLRMVTVGGGAVALMCFIYFLGGSFLVGPGAALLGLPGDFAQGGVGLAVGVALAKAVSRAYPPSRQLYW